MKRKIEKPIHRIAIHILLSLFIKISSRFYSRKNINANIANNAKLSFELLSAKYPFLFILIKFHKIKRVLKEMQNQYSFFFERE